MIRRILFAFLLMLLSSCPCFSQSPSDGGAGDDKVVRKSLLLSDLQALEADGGKKIPAQDRSLVGSLALLLEPDHELPVFLGIGGHGFEIEVAA